MFCPDCLSCVFVLSTAAPEVSVTFQEAQEHFGLHLKGTSGRDVYIEKIDEDSEAEDFAGLRQGLLLKQIDGQSVENMEVDAIMALANDGHRPMKMKFTVHAARQAKTKLKLAVKLGAYRRDLTGVPALMANDAAVVSRIGAESCCRNSRG